MCRKPVDLSGGRFRPFCSERCKTIDLGNWAAENYRIPGEKANGQRGLYDEEDISGADTESRDAQED